MEPNTKTKIKIKKTKEIKRKIPGIAMQRKKSEEYLNQKEKEYI